MKVRQLISPEVDLTGSLLLKLEKLNLRNVPAMAPLESSAKL
jgi:hypothetical protein